MVGIAPEIKKDFLGFFLKMQREYGDLVRYPAIGRYGYQLNHPDYVKHVLQDNHKNYRKSNAVVSRMEEVVGDGLLTSNGDLWIRQRRLAQPAFHRKRVAAYGRIMTNAAAEMLAGWHAQTEPIDIAAETMCLTLKVAGLTLFGLDLTHRAGDIDEAFSKVSEELANFPTYYLLLRALLPRLPLSKPRNQRFDEGMARLEAVVQSIIDRRRQDNSEHDDLLAMFMEVRDEETGQGMTDQQLRDEVMTMLLAGHETTSLALSWTFYLISQHPDAEKALHEELEHALTGHIPTVDDLPKLTYTRCLIEESMRLYPPAHSFNRQAIAEDSIDGYSIPAGAHMLIQPYVVHRHPEFWHEPERFDPERFSPQSARDRHRYAYLPFGGGPRQCIGAGLAMNELLLVTATVAQRFTLRSVPDRHVEPQPHVTLRPKGGLWMYVRPR